MKAWRPECLPITSEVCFTPTVSGIVTVGVSLAVFPGYKFEGYPDAGKGVEAAVLVRRRAVHRHRADGVQGLQRGLDVVGRRVVR